MIKMKNDPKERASERWFGYGRWDVPFWFVGKEPGGTDEAEQYASWLRLGGGELIDCRAHDLDCADSEDAMMWHGRRGHLQHTWRPLIALLLAYKGAQEYDKDAVWRYQDERWGSTAGETAVIELSAVAAPSASVPEALRLNRLPERIATIRARIARHRPKFVLFYGAGRDQVVGLPYLERWSEIAGVSLEPNAIVRHDETAYVAAPHATAHGLTNDFWTGLGRELARHATP
jgi:hypothetical protein